MKSGKCPKCGSTNIHSKMALGWRATLTVCFLNHAVLEDFICVDCGYLESYVSKKSKLDLIKSKWATVGNRS